MKAAVLTKLNKPLELLDLELPWVTHDSHLTNGQVLVDIICSGICGSQLMEIRGEKNNAGRLAHCMGHEGCGRIRAVGKGVSVQLIGKKCVLHWRKGDGPEAFTLPIYTTKDGRNIGAGHVTTLMEQAIVSANRVTVVPEDVPDELCALLGCGLSTALGTIEQEANVKFGESVLIVGAGGVGLNLIKAACLAGAGAVGAMDIKGEKHNSTFDAGANFFFVGETQITTQPSKFGHKTPANWDVIVDTSGSAQALKDTIPLLAPSGRYILLGHPKPGESVELANANHMFQGEGKSIRATQGGGFNPTADIPRYCNLWRSGRLNLDNIISHRVSLEDVNKGIELVRNGEAGRVLVMMK